MTPLQEFIKLCMLGQTGNGLAGLAKADRKRLHELWEIIRPLGGNLFPGTPEQLAHRWPPFPVR